MENQNLYYIDDDLRIFKKYNEYHLLLSPDYSVKDRRFFDISKLKLNRISKHKAYELLHKQFAQTTQLWKFNHEDYVAAKCFSEYSNMWQSIQDLPKHTLNATGVSGRDLILVMHNGEVNYLAYNTAYYPKCPAYGVNGNYHWVDIKWCKPIWNKTKNQWV